MNVVLISTYELGRQPFGLASPAAWLKDEGCAVTSLDLAVQPLSEGAEALAAADLIGFYLPMHTATRLAAGVVGRIRDLNPRAHLCFYGLYAPVNESYLRRLGAGTILGGEYEEGLVSLVRRLGSHEAGRRVPEQPEPLISLGRQKFRAPDRSGLPGLERYARLQMAPGVLKTVGYTEASRGCKHLCRHCPVVPVYQGNFRIVQPDVVLEDVRRQVAAGAEHVTFGDPDFFNGPTHAVKIVRALHDEFPRLTYDVTIKVEHLLRHREHLPTLRDTNCLFVTSAVEAIDDAILRIFDKNHTREQFVEAVDLFRVVGLHLNATFVTFTPWTTLAGYLELLHLIRDLDLIENVAPIQYAIRLLIPASSRLLELPEVARIVLEFDERKLFYPWVHPDLRVDRLCQELLRDIQSVLGQDEGRAEIFQRVWRRAHLAYEEPVASAREAMVGGPRPARSTVPYLTEPWYC